MVRNLRELGPNLQKIINRLQSNQKLLKLLYYNDKDPLSQPDLTSEQIQKEVFDKLIKIVPRIGPKETANSLISLRVVNGRTNSSNTEFKDIALAIEVFVPLTQWAIKDTNLRPFSIMGEIQESLNGKVVNGLGKIQGGDFALNFLTEEISCYEMTFDFIEYE
jgi:hypothetical protein